MTDEGSEDDHQRFWMRGSGERSNSIFISFMIVIVIMVLIVVSMGVYGYLSWQEWKRGPQIRVTEGLFESKGNDGDVKNFTVHLTLINEGQKKSQDINFEWIIMERGDANDNIYVQKDSKTVDVLEEDEEREFTFNISLESGRYTTAYRVYDDQLFSYEARQTLDVTLDDATSNEPETVSVPEFPVVIVPVLAVIALFILFRRKKYEKSE